MSVLQESLTGQTIDSVHSDSELTYIMLSNGTLVTVRGLLIVEPSITRKTGPVSSL